MERDMTTKKSTAAATPVDAAVTAGKETLEQMTKIGQDAAQKNMEQAMSMAKDNVEKASQTLFKGYEQANTLAQGNYEAVSKSFGILSKGFEDLSKAWMVYTQGTVDSTMAFGKQVLGAKSLNEVVDLQNTFSKSAFDSFVAESTKLSEMSVKTASEAIEPLKARVDETVETLSRPIAA
jgi:phasin family protein